MSGAPLATLPDTRDGRGRRWVEIVGLTAFAFSQSVFSVFADGASFLVAYELSGARLVGFVILLLLVPAAVLVILDELLLAVSGRLYPQLEASLRGLLIGLILAPPLNRVMGIDGLLSVVMLAAFAVLGTTILRRWGVPSAALTVLAVAPVVFAMWFLTMTPVSALLTPDDPTSFQELGRPDATVVWIIFDQFSLSLILDSNEDLADERFPNFARLASESTWYSAATTGS